MPVPTWACSDLGLIDEPVDTATVVSEDIWKKFNLDFPLDIYSDRAEYDCGFPEDNNVDCRDKSANVKFRKIRHHDCMWAGLCISEEHNRTLPAKKDNQSIQKKVPAGRSLLISRAAQSCQNVKNLESDGDSTRPETPQSSDSDTETVDEPPQFKHDQISINEKLSEYLGVAKAAPVSEVTGQLVRRTHEKRKTEETNSCGLRKETEIRNTLSDHCYHLNQTASKKLDHLGVQTPSDSEEEIDVVSFDKPSRPAALPTYPSPADHHRFQLTVNTALKDKPQSRPRGRPPSNNSPRKRSAQAETKPAKRAKQRTYQKRSKVTKAAAVAAAAAANSSGMMSNKSSSASRSSSDEEPDTEKRSIHNNMERQRRIELRNAFEELRVLVPEVEMKEKAPKVAILRQAAIYCDMLTEVSQVTIEKGAAECIRQSLQMTRLYY
ncbi:transcriptional regulator Myc-B isoform X2 [Cephus cinctus]|uniref:Transcriptional regulator Myc-B isoform X2 n=1 Tax=Cephus cinctus TaxID=211228 RepID=A0AAJ7VY88_CEPCN|nr:transcriptional regulator Myc-B isoform X2 [Cephus cinctus]